MFSDSVVQPALSPDGKMLAFIRGPSASSPQVPGQVYVKAEPARFAANAFAANGSPVYLYRFLYVASAMSERMRAGAPHGGEISFVSGTLGAGPGSTPSPEDLAVSRMAQRYGVNFARTGDPNGSGLPAWPTHDPTKDVILDFRPDGSAGAGPDPREARLDVTQLNTNAGSGPILKSECAALLVTDRSRDHSSTELRECRNGARERETREAHEC